MKLRLTAKFRDRICIYRCWLHNKWCIPRQLWTTYSFDYIKYVSVIGACKKSKRRDGNLLASLVVCGSQGLIRSKPGSQPGYAVKMNAEFLCSLPKGSCSSVPFPFLIRVALLLCGTFRGVTPHFLFVRLIWYDYKALDLKTRKQWKWSNNTNSLKVCSNSFFTYWFPTWARSFIVETFIADSNAKCIIDPEDGSSAPWHFP